jgi:hypothetical protein
MSSKFSRIKIVIGAAPLTPFIRAFQYSSTLFPIGEHLNPSQQLALIP